MTEECKILVLKITLNKVGHVSLMVLLSNFRLGQYREDDHREDAPTLHNIYFRQANMEQFIDTLASDKSNPGEWDPKAVYDKLPEIQGMAKF